jgi:hypothetical protein
MRWSKPTRGCCVRKNKLQLLVMAKVFETQRKCCFSALRTVTTYPQTRNALEHAVAWAIVWPGGGFNFWSPLSPNLNRSPTPLFPVGFCKRWSFYSTGHYNPEQLERTKTNTDSEYWAACTTKCVCRAHTYSVRLFCIVYTNFLSLHSQQCAFIMCVTIASFPLNLCYHIYCSNWKCDKSKLTECSPIKF